MYIMQSRECGASSDTLNWLCRFVWVDGGGGAVESTGSNLLYVARMNCDCSAKAIAADYTQDDKTHTPTHIYCTEGGGRAI